MLEHYIKNILMSHPWVKLALAKIVSPHSLLPFCISKHQHKGNTTKLDYTFTIPLNLSVNIILIGPQVSYSE